jgi:hypothetical protein
VASTINIITIVTGDFRWCLDTQRNDNQHKDTQHNHTQHKDTQHKDTQHKDTQGIRALSIMALDAECCNMLAVICVECYAECCK